MNAIQMMFTRNSKWAMGALWAAERYAETVKAARERFADTLSEEDMEALNAAEDAEYFFIKRQGKAAARWMDKIRAAIDANN